MNLGPLSYLQAILIGTASDLWTACILSFTALGVMFLIKHLPNAKIYSFLRVTLIVLSLSLLSSHYSYVKFFHTPFVAMHLAYIQDIIFLKSNYTAVIEPMVFISFAVFLFNVKLSHHLASRVNKKKTILISIFFIGSLGHIFHNRYKVQWHIPSTLQFNLLEHFYTSLRQQKIPQKLSTSEIRQLQAQFGIPMEEGSYKKNLQSIVLPKPNLAKELEQRMEASIKLEVDKLRRTQTKPIIITILMESFRAFDIGSPQNPKESYTPHFDQLSRSGILFKNAWSTGTVTRAGQEAVWCGYLSSMNHSTMREHPEIRLTCLPKKISNGHVFWYHGGDGRFDNQLNFWQRQGVSDVMSLVDFPKSTAKTGWGVGDRSFLLSAGNKIHEISLHNSKEFLFGMLLTVTNHIPWDLPSDAPAEVKNYNFRNIHPSEKTILYTDHALAEFVNLLKSKSLWDQTLLIVLGDHGIMAPIMNKEFNEDVSREKQASKIACLFSGGITERISSQQHPSKRIREEHISQVDIASFLAYLLDIPDFPSMGNYFFNSHRIRPIVSDLGDRIYFPETNKIIPYKDILSKNTSEGDILYYRSFLNLITEWNTKKG